MANQKNQALYTKVYWIFTAFMLLTAMPLGLVLIVVKLFERRKKRRAAIFRPVADAPLGAQTTYRPDTRSVQEALEGASKKMRRRASLGFGLVVVSAGLLALCAMYGINLWTCGCCLFVSLCYMLTGVRALASVGRFREYLAVMVSRPIMTVSELASQTRSSETQIRRDLGTLEFMELLAGAFLDRERDLIFCF